MPEPEAQQSCSEFRRFLALWGRYNPLWPLKALRFRLGPSAQRETRSESPEVLARRDEDVHSIDLLGVLGFPAVYWGSAGLASLHTESS
jgi:hypothetical protein